MKSIYAVMFAASLSGCAMTEIGGATVENYRPPVLDDSKTTSEQRATLPADLASCQKAANSAITPFEESAALYSAAEMTRVTEKRRGVRRQCLVGRGYAVLY